MKTRSWDLEILLIKESSIVVGILILSLAAGIYDNRLQLSVQNERLGDIGWLVWACW